MLEVESREASSSFIFVAERDGDGASDDAGAGGGVGNGSTRGAGLTTRALPRGRWSSSKGVYLMS